MAEKQSFSMRVKQEAQERISSRRHCVLAELAGLIILSETEFVDGKLKIFFENPCCAKKCFTLLKKTFNIDLAVCVIRHSGRGQKMRYAIGITGRENVREVLEALKLEPGDKTVNELLLYKSCCKRAFIRGCFLAAGSVTDPSKSYHLEIVTGNEEMAAQLCRAVDTFSESGEQAARYILRKRSSVKDCYVMYLKEGNHISDFLNVIETYRSLMEMENVRVNKEIANSLNRAQNCEMANMVKTISAGLDQCEDIELIASKIGLESLSGELYDVARLRLQYPDMPLRELGEMLNPPTGKSGVNHRLRKIKRIAQELRNDL
ncbi:MAG: DNA-binding protein WhiA [Lachnospiraceae bacterium]|nr:DNA-binding protein WhiA [Lachnospiraceae bacterium]